MQLFPSWIPVVSLLASSMAPVAAQVEIPLTFQRYTDEEEGEEEPDFAFQGTLEMESLAAPPAGSWTLPELAGSRPVFALAELGGIERLLIYHRKSPDSPFFDRLYLDANGNRDLTDDPVIETTERARFPGSFASPPIDITLTIDGHPVPYRFGATAFYESFDPDFNVGEEFLVEELALTLVSGCAYSGRFTLDGRDFRLLLGDGLLNGRFGDLAAYPDHGETNPHRAIFSEGDAFFLTDEKVIREHHQHLLGNQLFLGGRLFDLQWDLAASRLILLPVTGPLAEVEPGEETEWMSLASEDGARRVMLHRPGLEVKVQPGKYRLADYQVLRKDEQGDVWFLAAAASPRTPIIACTTGKGGSFAFGEPYVVHVTVAPGVYEEFKRKTPDQIALEFVIAGSADEVVSDLKRISGTRTKIPLDPTETFPREPRFRVFKPTGEEVASGQFEYG
jgi:hypothetical protein